MEHKAHVLPSLEVAKMRHQIAVWKPEDDWTGVTSAAERRTLQNRLNQRIYRKSRVLVSTTLKNGRVDLL